jgi:thiamine pyrophosphate-dependent acetolactate synthase large subunit-like protein
VQVEIEPTALARFFPVEVGILGDAGRVAVQLADALTDHRADEARTWTARFQADRATLHSERDAAGSRTSVPMQPAALFKALRAVAPTDAMFTMDAGTLCLQATDQMPYVQPPSLFTPLDFGLVGFSFACGLGAKVACPGRTVISLMGDGGFGMTVSELGTAVAEGINTVCVVMNNGCWGAEKAYQRDFFGGRYIGADVPNPRYDELAKLYGAAGFRVETPREAEDGLRAALPADAMFTMDAGTLCLQATDQMRYAQPPSLFTPLDFGLVGFSYAAGLGIKLACPDRTVVSLMGDGGFGMTVSEIGTAVQNGIDTVCIVMNNGCWGAEKAYQRDFFGERYIGADVPNPPYDKLAELYGARGFRVDKAAQIVDAVKAALACGKPAIVDVMVDPEALYSFRRDSFRHRDPNAK